MSAAEGRAVCALSQSSGVFVPSAAEEEEEERRGSAPTLALTPTFPRAEDEEEDEEENDAEEERREAPPVCSKCLSTSFFALITNVSRASLTLPVQMATRMSLNESCASDDALLLKRGGAADACAVRVLRGLPVTMPVCMFVCVFVFVCVCVLRSEERAED